MSTFLQAPVREYNLGFGKVLVPQRTGAKIKEIVRKSAKNEYVRKWAERIVENVPDRDKWGEAEAIFNFVQTKTRYAHDPRFVEYIQTPPYVLKHIELGMKPSLDCDDYVTLMSSLLEALGYKTAVRITGYGPDGKYTHVYGLVKIDNRWVPFDPVRKDISLGQEAPFPRRVMDIEI